MIRTALLTVLLAFAMPHYACDADVLRFDHKKKPTTKAVTAPASTTTKGAATRPDVEPSASLTASTKLEPR